MLTIAFAAFAAAHLAMTLWGIRLLRRDRDPGGVALVLPIALLVYDNGMVAIGALLGEGPLLKTLTLPRFIGHAFFTPIWIITAGYFARRIGMKGFSRRGALAGVWGLYGVMVVLGVIDSLILLDLVPEVSGGILYYTNNAGLPGPPAPAIVMVLVNMVVGVGMLRKKRSPWMLLGSLVMLVAAGIPMSIAGQALSAAGEVVMALSLIVTRRTLTT